MPGFELAAIVEAGTCALRRFYSTFPSGLPAVGLLVLRLAAGSLAIAQGVADSTPIRRVEMVSPVVEIGAGALLLAGFLTPFASAALAITSLSIAFSWIAPAPAAINSFSHSLFVAAIEVAITLLGPGWLSIDARLFGRHRIIIPTVRKEYR
jgi:uncharacterized membrane protein YphA (DoxX/SURF4 family)